MPRILYLQFLHYYSIRNVTCAAIERPPADIKVVAEMSVVAREMSSLFEHEMRSANLGHRARAEIHGHLVRCEKRLRSLQATVSAAAANASRAKRKNASRSYWACLWTPLLPITAISLPTTAIIVNHCQRLPSLPTTTNHYQSLGTNAINDHGVVICMANQVVEVGTVRRPSSLRVKHKSSPKP
jgi:hypothetical protein